MASRQAGGIDSRVSAGEYHAVHARSYAMQSAAAPPRTIPDVLALLAHDRRDVASRDACAARRTARWRVRHWSPITSGWRDEARNPDAKADRARLLRPALLRDNRAGLRRIDGRDGRSVCGRVPARVLARARRHRGRRRASAATARRSGRSKASRSPSTPATASSPSLTGRCSMQRRRSRPPASQMRFVSSRGLPRDDRGSARRHLEYESDGARDAARTTWR